MNCETLREQLMGDPAAWDETFARHAADCAPCRAFRERLFKAEALIGEALRFDVAGMAERKAAAARASGSYWIRLSAGIAAAVLGTLTLWTLLDTSAELATPELAQAVVDHWDHEPESLAVTETAVADSLLTEVLYGTADLDRTALTTVSFAKICRIGGRYVPHFVVQGESGPYMVVLLPGRSLDDAVPLEAADRGLAGHILPAGSGSIAVLGPSSDELDEMESRVSSAIRWEI